MDDATVASWVREGLPSDPTSVQNGTILTNSERWPLMMDPQLQACSHAPPGWNISWSPASGIHCAVLGYQEQHHQVILLPLTSTGICKAPPCVCQRCLAAIVMSAGHLQGLHVAAMMQGVVWIKERESKHNLQVVRMGAAGTVTAMERAIEAGHSVLIENMGESIDAVLNPVITRSTFKKVGAAAVQQACRGDPTA